MTFFLSRIKIWGLAFVGVVIAALAATVKLLSHRNSRLRHRAENAELKAKQAVIIAQADRDIEKAKRKVRNEIKNTGPDESFRNPNSLWTKSDDT
jgi:hypothetical protein